MAFIDEIIWDDELKSLDVEGWGGKTVYFKTFTLADSDYASKLSKGKDGEFIVYTLIRKCLDSDGTKLFTVADKMKLMNNFGADTLADIVVRMKGIDEVDAEKN